MISLLLENVVEKKNLYVRNDASLRSLIELMNRNGKGVVVVLDGKKPVGILTERDVIEILFKDVDLNERAEPYTKKNLITTRGDRTIGHALNLMIENNIRRMVVVNDENNFLGVITQQDMLKHLEEDFYRSHIKVKNIAEGLRPLIVASPDDSFREVLHKMYKNKISALPVIIGGKAAGIITEKDIIKLAGKRVRLDGKVNGHMSKPVIAAHLDSSLINVVKQMNDQGIRRVIIEDKAKQALHIVTNRDVLRNLEGDYSDFLERKLRHTRDLLDLLPEMLVEVSDTGKEHIVIWANVKVLCRFGRKIIDRPVTNLIPRNIWDKIYHALITSYKIEDVRFKMDDDMFEVSGFFIKTDGKMEKGRVQLLITDITQDIKLSITDPLTGLYNRRFINEVLLKEIERDKRLNKKFSIVILDLDNFKKLNDTFGHLAGDIALKAVAWLMNSNIRKLDIIGRYGGEEFVILMPETSKSKAFDVSERIRLLIEKKQIAISGRKKIKLTASFGIATFEEDGMLSGDLLLMADERLYKAKREGKNKIVID